MKNMTKAHYKPASLKPFIKALNWCCYMIAFNAVANVVMFGFVTYQPERIGEGVRFFLLSFMVMGGTLGLAWLIAWLLALAITVLMGKPMVILRKGKVLVLDNSNDANIVNSADIEVATSANIATMVTKP